MPSSAPQIGEPWGREPLGMTDASNELVGEGLGYCCQRLQGGLQEAPQDTKAVGRDVGSLAEPVEGEGGDPEAVWSLPGSGVTPVHQVH